MEQSVFKILYRGDEFEVKPYIFENVPEIYSSLKKFGKFEIFGDFEKSAISEFIGFFSGGNVTLSNYFDVFDLLVKFSCNNLLKRLINVIYNTKHYNYDVCILALKSLSFLYSKYFDAEKVCEKIVSFLQNPENLNKIASNSEFGKVDIKYIENIIKEAKIFDPEILLLIYKQYFIYNRFNTEEMLYLRNFIIEQTSNSSELNFEAAEETIKNDDENEEKFYEYQVLLKQQELETMIQFYKLDEINDLSVLENNDPPVGYEKDIFNAIKNNKMESIVYTLWKRPSVVSEFRDGLSPLHLATMLGNEKVVKHLIAKNAEIDLPTKVDKIRLTALHIAIMTKKISIIKLLLDNNAALNSLTLDQNTPIMFLATFKDAPLEIAELLIDSGSELESFNTDGMSALMLAVKNGNNQLAEFLISKGALIDASNERGETAFSVACTSNNIYMANYLLDYGAELMDYETGNSMLITVLKSKCFISEDIIKLLFENGMDVNRPGASYTTPIHEAVLNHSLEEIKMLFKYSEPNINAIDWDEKSPLHDAVISNKIDVVKFLLEKGAEISKDYNGRTPFHYACTLESTDIAEMFFELNRDDLDLKDELKRTPMHYAVIKNSVNCLKFLLENGANTEIEDIYHRTPFHYAVLSNNIEIFNILVNETNVNQPCYFNEESSILSPPILIAVELCSIEMFNCLLEHGADINAVDSNRCNIVHSIIKGNKIDLLRTYVTKENINAADLSNKTPLHYAMEKENMRALNMLLVRKANPNVKDSDGFTPLMIAVRMENVEAVYQFIDCGADLSIKCHGKNVLHVAVGKKNHALIKALLEGDVSRAINVKDDNGMYPLQIAIENDDSQAFSYLVQANADINIKSYQSEDPLIISLVQNRKADFIKVVLGTGLCDPDVVNGSEMALLYKASPKKVKDALSLFIQFPEENPLEELIKFMNQEKEK